MVYPGLVRRQSVQVQPLGRAEGSIREQSPRSAKGRIQQEGQELLLTCKHSAQETARPWGRGREGGQPGAQDPVCKSLREQSGKDLGKHGQLL